MNWQPELSIDGKGRADDRQEERVSIGAELPPAPVQCPGCRKFVNRGELHEVEAKGIGEPTQVIVVCDPCYRKVNQHGTIRLLIAGKLWRVGLPEERPIPGR